MIKNITIILVLLYLSLLPLCSLAQENNCELQKWEWAQQITTTGNTVWSQVSSVEHDSLDNLYIAGHYIGQISLGDTTLYAGPPNILANHSSDFLAKFDSEGNLIWAQNTGDSDQILLKLSNNDLVVLQFSDSVYLSKFSSKGEVHWRKSVGVLQYRGVTSLEVDRFGNIYIGGYFKDAAYFSDQILLSPEETSGFISKFDEQATLEWTLKVASKGFSEIDDLALNSVGDVYAVGFFYGSIKYGVDSIYTDGSNNAMMLKYNSEGENLFIENIAKAPIESYGESLTIDRNDDVLVGGSFASTNTSSEDTATTIIGTDQYTLTGTFIAKYDQNGLFIWSEKVEDGGQKFINDLETDSANDIYVGAGAFTHTIYKYGSNGIPLWNIPVNSFMYNASQFLIDINHNEELVITGRFESEITFGEFALNPVNGFDYYLAKIDISTSLPSPHQAASDIHIINENTSSIHVSWENGDGTGRLVLLKKLGKVSPSNIEDGIIYSDGGGVFGLGTQTGEREFVVYVGSGSEVTITGLQKGRPYQVAIIEYNDSTDCPNQINYLQDDVAKKIFITSGGVGLFSAYPNPLTQDVLIVQLPDEVSAEDLISLNDAYGKKILQRKIKNFARHSGEVQINMESLRLQPGIYFLSLTGQPTIRLIQQ